MSAELSEFAERWVGSTAIPVSCIQRGAKVRVSVERTTVVTDDLLGGSVSVQERPGIKHITFVMERDGEKVVVYDMPANAPTKSCEQDRHDSCGHRLSGPHEGGVMLKTGLDYFIWRCGCMCHRDPARAGRLF